MKYIVKIYFDGLHPAQPRMHDTLYLHGKTTYQEEHVSCQQFICHLRSWLVNLPTLAYPLRNEGHISTGGRWRGVGWPAMIRSTKSPISVSSTSLFVKRPSSSNPRSWDVPDCYKWIWKSEFQDNVWRVHWTLTLNAVAIGGWQLCYEGGGNTWPNSKLFNIFIKQILVL